MSNGALSQNANSVDDRTAKRAAAKASQTTILRREIGWRLKAQYDALLAEPLPPRPLHWSRNSKVFPPIPNNRSRYAAFSIRVDSLNHPGRGHVADNARGLNRGAVHQPQRYVPGQTPHAQALTARGRALQATSRNVCRRFLSTLLLRPAYQRVGFDIDIRERRQADKVLQY